MKKTPVIFVGHGSPMLAIDENDLTREMQRIGADILNSPEKPKAILAVSAHWFAPARISKAPKNHVKYTICTASRKNSTSFSILSKAMQNSRKKSAASSAMTFPSTTAGASTTVHGASWSICFPMLHSRRTTVGKRQFKTGTVCRNREKACSSS